MSLLLWETAHTELARAAMEGRLNEEDALVWMVLLHTHEIHLHGRSTEDALRRHERNGVVSLSAHTQRGVAAAIAELWAEIKHKRGQHSGDQRTRYEHWYWEFNTRGYESVENIPARMKSRLEELRVLLTQDPRVVAVVPDSDLL